MRAYTSLFFNHLCEPGDPSSLTFEDGVPKEGLNVNQVLTRIGIISLIKRKVHAYQSYHGVVSLPKPKVKKSATPNPVASTSSESAEPVPPSEVSSKDADNVENSNISENKKVEEGTDISNKTESMDVDGESIKQEDESKQEVVKESDKSNDDVEMKEIKTEDTETTETVSSTKMEMDEAASSSNATVTNGHVKKEDEEELLEEEEEEELPPTTVKEFEFNIEDGGLTELHTLWYFEERELKPGHEHEVWNRRHDFWLLSGIVKHGYDQFAEICNDPDLAFLLAPFKTSATGIREKFMDRRLKLIEQALVLEEQIRRFRHLESVEKYIKKPVEEPPKESTEEEEGVEEKEDKDNEKSEKEDRKVNPEEANKEKMNGEKTADQDKEDDGDKENEELILNPMVQKAANQLEDLIIDMKSDCARIPQTLQRVPSFASRLQLIQRNLAAPGNVSAMSQGRMN